MNPLSIPVWLAPMAGAGGVELAIAVARGGGMASLPCGMATPEQVERDVAAFRAAVDAPLNLNFFCHTLPDDADDSAWRSRLRPFYEELAVSPGDAPPLRRPFSAASADLVEALRPDVVSFHFGLPDQPLLDRVRATGALVLGCATSVEEAEWLAERGVDAVVAQGIEAGGHNGRFLSDPPLTTFALVPQVVDATGAPVIAAGGVSDRRGVQAALALGATAAQIGTAYLRCPESLISQAYRAALASPAARRTVVTNLFSGGLARGMPNRLIEALGAVHPDAPPYPHASSALAPLRKAAESAGRGDFSPLWAGEAAPLARPMPAERLTGLLLGRE